MGSFGNDAAQFAWFRSEGDYRAVRDAIIDPHQLPPNLRAYRDLVEKMEYTQQRHGVVTARVYVQIDGFVAYCSRCGVKAQAAMLSSYAGAVYNGIINDYDSDLGDGAS